MTIEREQSSSASSVEQTNVSTTLLSGRLLLLARIVWGMLAVGALVLFAFSLPLLVAQLQIICTAPPCNAPQPTPDLVRALQGIGFSVEAYAVYVTSLITIAALVWFIVAGVIVWRKSADWMALLVALMLVTQGAYGAPTQLQLDQPLMQFLVSSLSYLAFVSLALVFSLFPDGHFVPRWTLWLMGVWVLVDIVSAFNLVPNSAPLLFQELFVLLWYAYLGSFVVAQVYRYRRVSNRVQRQQTKWIIFGVVSTFCVEVVVLLAELIPPTFGHHDLWYALVIEPFGDVASVLIPLAFGFAILRYHLYDIDVLINRTLVYGTLTASLALVYFGLIFALQYLLRGFINQNNDVAIVVSTLAIAALFLPLRHRLQLVIDRRFYRRKYDAARTVAAFSAALRDEVDLKQVSEQLMAVVQETMQPAHISLWLRNPEPSRARNTRRLPSIDEEESVAP